MCLFCPIFVAASGEGWRRVISIPSPKYLQIISNASPYQVRIGSKSGPSYKIRSRYGQGTGQTRSWREDKYYVTG